MRKLITLLGAVGLAGQVGCTVKKADAPPLAGPSTLARAIYLRASPDVLLQNGTDTSRITVEVKDPNGRPVEVVVRAAIMAGGVIQDFGSLSTKLRATDPTTGATEFIYTAPPAPISGPATAQLVTIAVTPVGTDFGSELTRTVDIRLLPVGVIGPSNPTLVAAFTVTPNPPKAFNAATFDASTSTNQGTPCGTACTYAWDFGDGTSGTGIKTTHEYRTAGTKAVQLTVADSFGATASTVQTFTVAASDPPTADFVVSPSAATVGQDVFFNASTAKPAAGRTITTYAWDFGDRETGSGVTVTHRYRTTGTFTVVLVVTDDAGSKAQKTASVVVSSGNPTASLTFLPAAPKVGLPVFFDASGSTAAVGAQIVSYGFDYGDGQPEEVGTVPNQSHVYNVAGTYVVTLRVTDNFGRTAIKQVSVTVSP
jgi:PKD repeat protein